MEERADQIDEAVVVDLRPAFGLQCLQYSVVQLSSSAERQAGCSRTLPSIQQAFKHSIATVQSQAVATGSRDDG
jgi:hypothetical protein